MTRRMDESFPKQSPGIPDEGAMGYDCDGVSCGCFERGTGCILASLRAKRTLVEAPTEERQFAFDCRPAAADLPPEPESAEYQAWVHPVQRAQRRQTWFWGSLAAVTVVGTLAFFAHKQQQILESTRRLVEAQSREPVVKAKVPEARWVRAPKAAVDGYQVMLLDSEIKEETTPPPRLTISMEEASERTVKISKVLFASYESAEAKIQHMAGEDPAGKAALLVKFERVLPTLGGLNKAAVLQERVMDAEWDQAFPHVVITTEKSGARGLLTRLIPCQDQEWRLDVQMLLDSAAKQLSKLATTDQAGEQWVTVVAKRLTGLAESKALRERHVVLECVTDLAAEDRAVILVDRMSHLAERLEAGSAVGESFSGAALLAHRKIDGEDRLVASKFLSMAP